MFTFDPIDRRRYRFVMIVASGLMIVIVTNFAKFMEVVAGFWDCRDFGAFCSTLKYDVPGKVILAAILLFLVTVAIATMRRVSATPISNYWVVLISIFVFLDYRYLIGLDVVWSGDFTANLYKLPIPWYLLSAVSLIVLLSFASERSTYFLEGYWRADPPLGYGLSISSFWLLAFSSTKIVAIIATATGNRMLWLTGDMMRRRLDEMLPQALTSPAIPAAVLITCAVLLTVLGRLKQGSKSKADAEQLKSLHRRQAAVRTTKAAQRLSGHKV